MKKIAVIIIVLLVLCIIGVVGYINATESKTALQAIQKKGFKVGKVIHEEKIDNGTFVFFIDDISDTKNLTLQCGFVKRTITGWKWIDGGGVNGTSDMPCAYLAYDKNTPFPIIFGYINNDKIQKVKVLIDDEQIIYPKVMNTGNLQYWFQLLNNKTPKKIKAIGLTNSDEEIRNYSLLN